MEDFISDVDVKRDESGGSGETTSSHKVVRNAMEDLFTFQRNKLDQVRCTVDKQKENYIPKITYEDTVNKLKMEKLDHLKTRLMLDQEKDKLEFAVGENEILKTQMSKQKQEYESIINTLQNKASRETKRSDFLYERCSELEENIEKLEDNLQLKDNLIVDLKQRLKVQKENYKFTLEEISINKMQQHYMTKTLSESQKSKR